ncbi:hypothetical protein VTJ83DRAFT_6701 [Remersonia thermophila]|uniref:Uncharacterized protein n=1 Tax=Remersonia thermophila TaxID=72144 RepID=A0ABR4D5G9_9PEZI
MPPREILDSEDDGSEFGEEDAGFNYNDQGGTDQVDVRDVPRDIEVPASHTNSTTTGSTDPSFFQHIYDRHQQHQHQHQQPTIADTQSFIPDTVPNTTRSLASEAEVVDLTGVPTPRKSADDDREAAGGSSARSRRDASARTYGKRNAAQPSPEQKAGGREHGDDGGAVDDPLQNPPATLLFTLDPYAFPDATPPARRRARGSQEGVREGVPAAAFSASGPSTTTQELSSSPVMLVPTEAPRQNNRKRKAAAAATTEAPGSSSGMLTVYGVAAAAAAAGAETESTPPDTLPLSVYLQPSTLTASQKQEYRVIHLSSQPGSLEPVMDHPPSFVPEISGGSSLRSSDATVVCPTPSYARLPREEGDGTDETGGVGDMGYQSSPDVLIDMTASTSSTRSKKARVKAILSSGRMEPDLEAPPSTNRARKKRVFREVDDSEDEFDPARDGMPQPILQGEEMAMHEENTVDNGSAAAEMEGANNDEPMEATATPGPKAPAKSKRSRKKKVDASSAAEPASGATMPPEPPAKRKRGRPRKPDASSKAAEPAAPVEPVEPTEQPEPPVEETARTRAENDSAAGEEPSARPFSELEHNSQPGPASGAEGSDGVGERGATEEKENGSPEAPGNDAKKDDQEDGELKTRGKDAGAGTGKGLDLLKGKGKYRVGLNRMSRVPSLLKVIKKPT